MLQSCATVRYQEQMGQVLAVLRDAGDHRSMELSRHLQYDGAMPTRFFRPFWVTLVALFGCSSDPAASSPDAATADVAETEGDSSAETATDSTPSETGPGCNAITYAGPATTVMASSAVAPTLSGGTIVSGTYVLDSATFYGGGSPPIPSIRTTVEISGTTIQSITTSTTETDARSTSTITVADSKVTIRRTCPETSSTPATFQATPTTLVLATSIGINSFHFHYSKK